MTMATAATTDLYSIVILRSDGHPADAIDMVGNLDRAVAYVDSRSRHLGFEIWHAGSRVARRVRGTWTWGDPKIVTAGAGQPATSATLSTASAVT